MKRQIADLKQRTTELSSDHKKVKIEFDEEIFRTKMAKNMMEEKFREQEKELWVEQHFIEVLGNDYKAWRQGEITEEMYVCNCKSRCDTPFEIGLCGEQSISRYAEQYKVFYNTDSKTIKTEERWIGI